VDFDKSNIAVGSGKLYVIEGETVKKPRNNSQRN
jgi:hypothetical protein